MRRLQTFSFVHSRQHLRAPDRACAEDKWTGRSIRDMHAWKGAVCAPVLAPLHPRLTPLLPGWPTARVSLGLRGFPG